MGKNERRMPRKPATKFPHLRKKLDWQEPAALWLSDQPLPLLCLHADPGRYAAGARSGLGGQIDCRE